MTFNEFSTEEDPPSTADSTGWGILFGLGAELTESVNAVVKVSYTESAPNYQFDYFTGGTNTGDDYEQFGVLGALSAQLADNLSGQIAGFWGSSDNTGNSISFTPGGDEEITRVERDVWGVGGLLQWRPASGFDILAEVIYRNVDYKAGDINDGDPDNDEVFGYLHARTSF